MLPLMSGLAEITADAVARLIPVKTTSNVSPRTPLSGVTRVITGAGGTFTVNVMLAAPPSVVTPSVVGPIAAAGSMVMLAVTSVSEALTMLPLMSGLAEITADAVARLIPVKTTSNVSPRTPLSGVTWVITGAAGGFTVNGRLALPPRVVRPSVVAPIAAAASMVMVAVTEVSEALSILPLMPGLSEITADALARLLPTKVTVNVVLSEPLSGVTLFSTGSGKFCVVKLATNSLDRPLPARSRMPLARMRML